MNGIEWVCFADDWGRLPSTTQHLIRHLPASDRVVWVDSIGMRTPTLSLSDVKRVWGKLRAMAGQPGEQLDDRRPCTDRFRIVRPRVAPFHDSAAAVRFNHATLAHDLRDAMRELNIRRPVVVISNTMAWLYVDAVRKALADPAWNLPVVYLRLDAFDVFPGVEPGLVHRVEPDLVSRCDHVFATAEALIPPSPVPSTYLPQGVDARLFAQIPLTPPSGRTIGYYGNIAEWLDYELIVEAVQAFADWTFDFIGPVRVKLPEAMRTAGNVRLLGPCPYPELPQATAHWRGAWMPFVINDHIQSANPLKMREYLAAGFPIACTRFREAECIADQLTFVENASTFGQWLEGPVCNDSSEARSARRAQVVGETWDDRIRVLRGTVTELIADR